jgi:lipoprotein-anchoring transpeptidase ErfK/SrfK
MTTIKSSIRIAVAVTLVLAMSLAGLYAPAARSGANGGDAGVGAPVAYAEETTEAPIDIATALVEPVEDQIYTGKVKKPTPKLTLPDGAVLKKNKGFTISYENNKLPGTAIATIEGKAPKYTGVIQITFNIIVQTPKGFKLKGTGDSVDVSWKKPSGKLSGYQVLYAEDEGFTETKKTKTIDSGKTTSYSIDRPYYARSYYVKMRAFVKAGGDTYYSDYTVVKNKETPDASWFKKVAPNVGGDTKWIEADLSKQIVYLHKGTKIVKTYAMSSGRPGTPTIRGTFKLYQKIKKHDMRGDWDPETQEWGYVTPNVKWAAYFKEGYAFHGSYWNSQVNIPVDEERVPRSHGCVNMREKDAKYLYNWAPIGTLVVVHK